MSFKKVDHIAIAVPELNEAISLFSALLKKEPDHIEEVADQKVKAAFFGIGDADSDPTNIELLFPVSEDSPISKFLANLQGRSGLHHICLEVTDLEGHLADLKSKGVRLIDEKPRTGAHGKKIAFIHPKSTNGILIELSEKAIVTGKQK